MAVWIDPQDRVLASVTALAAELADPIRLTVLQLLTAEGPHTLSRLADTLDVTAPRLANHLARLRARGLVTVERTGRHAVYRASAPGLDDVLAALARYAHADPSARPGRPAAPGDIARTCYGHTAGRLGVAVYTTLVDRDALRPPDGDGTVTLGPGAAAFADFGIDLDGIAPGRRKLATACLDRTLRLPHLGGVLGDAVLDAFLRRGLVEQNEGSRDLTITAEGAEALPALLPGFTPDPEPMSG
ncbi:ArsR/SmtB family transcription factor [Actinomadura fibrosa]|uniref:ArsR/SmtB family transcription factor n=1 Tax=Actinomadura fibrosa TaxID=111802 RepID=A0ABW2XBQ7_9ACTN|nr:metalloregulator ArsR/SmtB family transcription factor [Actinomadura fibrosa]